jgi:predicted RNA-binding protein with PUA-like domain
MVRLTELKQVDALKDMQLFTNSRLSVQMVKQEEWDTILELAEGDAAS